MTKTTPTFTPFFYTVFFFLHLVLLVTHAGRANSQLNAKEQTVLLNLKQYWQNPPSLSHWNPLNSSHYCDWPEITCTNGSVTQLLLPNKNITQTVPSFICDLNNLTLIDLSHNNIFGEFPKALYKCSKLQDLDLSRNYFNGTIPLGIHRLSRLCRLNLGANSFSGKIPTGVPSWRNLVVFEASNNLFTGTIPQQLTALPRLTTLLLDQNRLLGFLPSDIISWKSLNTLNLSRNEISGRIPEKLAYLPGLTELDLSENQLSGQIPPQLGLLKLTSLNLSSNHLTGKIPTQFENNAYARSFLNNPTLCASKPSLNIHSCKLEPLKSSKIPPKYLALIIGVVMGVGVCLLAKCLLIRSRRKVGQDSPWVRTAFQPINFTESAILSGLTVKNVIGSGGSGKVYRVVVNPPHNFVAVKEIRNNRKAEQNEKEFLAEVKILGSIQHSNIVKLLCCISNDDSKLLVYEYSNNHSLDQWLHRKIKASTTSSSVHHVVLDWPKRLQIAIGAAQGLFYMHHGCFPPIVHRDVKSSNILLDSEFNAKIADFGLAKILPVDQEHATMSNVAGTYGHIDPEYYRTRQVKVTTDVYSFGVVLLELATGRKPWNGNDAYLAYWASCHISEKKPIVDALDEQVKKTCYLDAMSRVFNLGIDCTNAEPSKRPSMKEVVQILLECNQPLVCGETSGSQSAYPQEINA